MGSASAAPPPVGAEGVKENGDAAAEWTSLPLSSGMSSSLWLETVRNNPLLDHRTTPQLPNNADVVIIGSGVGIPWCLVSSMDNLLLTMVEYRIARCSPNPPSSVVCLEARELCSGATGRNAGHCKPDRWRGFTKYSERFGPEQALKVSIGLPTKIHD